MSDHCISMLAVSVSSLGDLQPAAALCFLVPQATNRELHRTLLDPHGRKILQDLGLGTLHYTVQSGLTTAHPRHSFKFYKHVGEVGNQHMNWIGVSGRRSQQTRLI